MATLRVASNVARLASFTGLSWHNGRPPCFPFIGCFNTSNGDTTHIMAPDRSLPSITASRLLPDSPPCGSPRYAVMDSLAFISQIHRNQSSQIQLPHPCGDGTLLPTKDGRNHSHEPISMPGSLDDKQISLEDVTINNVWVYEIGATCLFNKIRTDTKSRKRAFAKRGYFRQTRSVLRKENRLKYAYALQGIDYDMLENLKMGEIPDISAIKR